MKVKASPSQPACPLSPLVPAPRPGALQEIPLCTLLELEVTLTGDPVGPDGMHIGVVLLANDGSIVGLPEAGSTLRLTRRGESVVIPIGVAQPPLEAVDQVLVFGTPTAVSWYLMSAASVRGAAGGLDGYVRRFVGGTRGATDVEVTGDPLPWTSSYLPIRVVAEPGRWPEQDLGDPGVCDRREEQLRATGCPAR